MRKTSPSGSRQVDEKKSKKKKSGGGDGSHHEPTYTDALEHKSLSDLNDSRVFNSPLVSFFTNVFINPHLDVDQKQYDSFGNLYHFYLINQALNSFSGLFILHPISVLFCLYHCGQCVSGTLRKIVISKFRMLLLSTPFTALPKGRGFGCNWPV